MRRRKSDDDDDNDGASMKATDTTPTATTRITATTATRTTRTTTTFRPTIQQFCPPLPACHDIAGVRDAQDVAVFQKVAPLVGIADPLEIEKVAEVPEDEGVVGIQHVHAGGKGEVEDVALDECGPHAALPQTLVMGALHVGRDLLFRGPLATVQGAVVHGVAEDEEGEQPHCGGPARFRFRNQVFGPSPVALDDVGVCEM